MPFAAFSATNSVIIHDSAVSEVNRGSPWLTVAHRGSPWLTVAHRGSPWLTVAHRGSPWLTVAHRGSHDYFLPCDWFATLYTVAHRG